MYIYIYIYIYIYMYMYIYIYQLYFDNDIVDKIVDCTNTRINETIARLQQTDNFNESSKYT